MRRDLPDVRVREAISDVVHSVIVADVGDLAWKRCYLYAAVGAALATEATGNEYTVRAGKIDIGRPHEPGYVLDPAHDPQEWHAWFTAPWPKGSMRHHETVDLAARHYRRYIESVGVRWNLVVPSFLWGRREEIVAMGVRLDEHAATTAVIRKTASDQGGPEGARTQRLVNAARELLRGRDGFGTGSGR